MRDLKSPLPSSPRRERNCRRTIYADGCRASLLPFWWRLGGSFFFFLLFFLSLPVRAQLTAVVRGTVCDSLTGEPLSFASYRLKGTNRGGTTDSEGHFIFSIPKGKVTLQASFIGYNPREVTLSAGQSEVEVEINLMPSGITLAEATVKPRRQKYKKKGNPAVDFVRRVIARRQEGDPREHDFYSYDQYTKMLFAKNDYTPKLRKSGKKSKFDFASEFADTTDDGTAILPVSEKEKAQSVFFRRTPRTERTVVRGYKSSGIDEIFSSDGVRQFLEEVFRESDLNQNNIPLFLQRFVSPLSTIGPGYYKYYLLDTLDVSGHRCADLAFVPFNSETFAFTGHLYVRLDSTYFVQKAVLNVPKKINLNFVSGLTIEQDYELLPDSTRIKTRDDIQVNFKLSERTKGMYARRTSLYSNHNFSAPPDSTELLFSNSSPTLYAANAQRQNDDFWKKVRPAQDTLSQNKKGMEAFMARLKSVPAFRITMQAFSILVNGYVPTHADPQKSKFEFGPMNTTVNNNTLEGMRFRVGGTTTTALSRHFFLDGFMAYGIDDEKLKYSALAEYSFNERKEFRKEYPLHSLRLEYSYDINKLGQEYMYTSRDNMMLMIRRRKDRFITYLRQAQLIYYHEHPNGLAYGAVLRNRREESSPITTFERIADDGTLSPVGHYTMTEMELKFRYARNEKFYQTRNWRVPITFDALIFNFSHRMAAKGFLGSHFNYQRTDIGVQKRIWFSAFGYVDIIAKAGKVWTKVPWPLLIHPNANLSYTIQPESYTNLNALEFINDQYASWDITYYLNGNLLNRLPLIKKLKWREVFCFRGLWGNLTDKNNPARTARPAGLYQFPAATHLMGRKPYMEASAGIENIFKCLRIDYVWRLSYRHNPGIQKNGVRMTFALSF